MTAYGEAQAELEDVMVNFALTRDLVLFQELPMPDVTLNQ